VSTGGLSLILARVKPSVEDVWQSLASIYAGRPRTTRSGQTQRRAAPRRCGKRELASHNHRARASIGELDDGPGTRNRRRNGGVGRRAAEAEHVPTQSAGSSVAATPPPAFLRCRLSGTLDDGAPFGRHPAARLRRLSRPLSPATGATLAIACRFPTAAQATIAVRGRARVVCHQAVGKFTGSGLHHLESARFRIWNGMASSITIDEGPPSPTSRSPRSIIRQPPTSGLASSEAVALSLSQRERLEPAAASRW
jgi:hypothetical protein